MLIRRYIVDKRYTLGLLAALSGVGAVVSILLLHYLNERAAHGVTERNALVVAHGLALLAATLGVRLVNAYIASRFGSVLVAELRKDLCGRFLGIDLDRLMYRKHAVFGALIEDIDRVAPLIQMAPQFLNNALLSVLGIGYLLYLSPALFAVVAPFIVAAGLLFLGTERLTKRGFDELRRADERLFELFRTLGEGKKELTLNPVRAEHFSSVLLKPAIGRARQAQFLTELRWGFVNGFAEVLSYAWVLAAILVGGMLLGASSTLILQFVIAGLFLSGPITSLFGMGAAISGGMASVRHLESIGLELARTFEEVGAGAPSATEVARLRAWRHIRLEGVRYAYPKREKSGFELGPIDLDIVKGEIVFISGGNGSGKSTLLLILCGLLTPSSGRIVIDGQPLDVQDTAAYRSLFSAVFFDFTLFTHPIDACGQAVQPAQFDEWVRFVDMQEKVRLEGDAFSTIDLSQGQRKRLALVQSCLDDRDIMIFDELTADQDRHFRQSFYQSLLPTLRQQGKTLLVVTHDDRYWTYADRVLTLELGRLLDQRCSSGMAPSHPAREGSKEEGPGGTAAVVCTGRVA